MSEVWRDILGYEGYYQISNYGRVKSLSRKIVVDGRFNRFYKERILKERVGNRGYYLVNLWKESIQYTTQVHQLVAIAFLNHKPNGYNMIINHIDFNKLNNRVENLEIVTSRENTNKKHLKSSSKHVGVSWVKNTSKWSSVINFKGKKLNLGYYNDENDAHLAYQKALSDILENGDVKINKSMASKYKGVSKYNSKGLWRARVTNNKKLYYLGCFHNEYDAHLAYQKALQRIENGLHPK